MMVENILKKLNIAALNPMQVATIAAAKKTKNLILYSPTGSGKTLAFLLPVLPILDQEMAGVQALILVPSRELAIQIEQVFKSMATGFKVNSCYGGHATKIEKNNLQNPPAILVGTPGRIAFHIRNHSFDTNSIHTLVLDEFDKSLEFGFKEDMSFIIQALEKLENRFLTSATKLDEIPSFTGVTDPVLLNYLSETSTQNVGLTLKVINSPNKDKLDTLFLLLCNLGNEPSLVFCNHRESVDRISELLWEKGLAHGVFHGGMDQIDRERALIKFRNGSHKILITTDLAARGLDIPEIQFVVHYQLPFTQDVFIHRNGRTARMNAKGTSYLILSAEEKVPSFINEKPLVETLTTNRELPAASEWSTLYIASGKKDKINKIDIVGLLLKKGNLQKDEVGLIEVLDRSSYAAIRTNKINTLLPLLKDERIKGKKIKMEISN